MIDNYRQLAAAELIKAIAHLDACLMLWSPSKGLTPQQMKLDGPCLSWERLSQITEELRQFQREEGP